MIAQIRVRARGGEHGFTMIELVTTVVIMGLIVVPLSMIALQALQLVPATGARTQGATDRSRLISQFSDDVANAQQIDFYDTGATQTVKQAFKTGTGVWSNAASQGPFSFGCSAGPRSLVTFT